LRLQASIGKKQGYSCNSSTSPTLRYKVRNLLGVPVDVLTPGTLPEKARQTVIFEARPV
jgi:predicted nucleotidyltransferase